MKDYGWFQTSQMIFSNKDGGLSHPKLKAMAKMYNMDNVSNVEVVTKKCWWGWITQNQYCNKIMLRWSSSGSDLVWRRSGRRWWSRLWICFWFSKVSLIMKMVIFREGWSLSALCIAISMLGRRKGSWPSTLSKLTGLLKKKWRNGLNTGLLTTLLLLSFLYD